MKQENLIWLCGFVDSESEDTYKHNEADRKKLKEILKELRALKE